ncbi:MAG: tetrathionate reductase family octaheme c-type cytochrome [Desulfobacteraceae bacterium]|nr:tetrathionate reductase family octaheme c-type cytochrome [Desulfobacteraceae bacterium]
MKIERWRPFWHTPVWFLSLILVIGILPVHADENEAPAAPGRTMARQAIKGAEAWSTVDHAKLQALNKNFATGAEITDACLSCHSEADAQFRESIHWTWLANGDREKGKAGYSLNNFCLSTNKLADESCLACHPGWGTRREAINCLACHSRKTMNFEEAFEDYQAFSVETDDESIEIAKEIQVSIQAAAQDIGRPVRDNCGSCHFYGGGGDGVKHGDLDSSLAKPSKSLDVHMGVDGQNFDCVRCHTTVSHHIAGRVYTTPAASHRKSLVEDDLAAKITCESCHTATPHRDGSKVNDHTDKVACQTCHIPEFAREKPTKLSWDWSQAGKLKDGKPYKTKDEFGQYDYMSIKGSMEWAKQVRPEYHWFNGSIRSLTLKDEITPGETVPVSRPVGGREDINSRIYPFKIHRGVQPYDTKTNRLLAPLLSGADGYWTTLDWQRALSTGMKAVDLEYSGDFEFVESTYVFPITHMVAPGEKALSCNDCHVNTGSRLSTLTGFYMPGRDAANPVNSMGWLLVLGSVVGILVHGVGRFFTNGNKEK